MSAVMNILHNAFKSTPPGGHVLLRARADHGRLTNLPSASAA